MSNILFWGREGDRDREGDWDRDRDRGAALPRDAISGGNAVTVPSDAFGGLRSLLQDLGSTRVVLEVVVDDVTSAVALPESGVDQALGELVVVRGLSGLALAYAVRGPIDERADDVARYAAVGHVPAAIDERADVQQASERACRDEFGVIAEIVIEPNPRHWHLHG